MTEKYGRSRCPFLIYYTDAFAITYSKLRCFTVAYEHAAHHVREAIPHVYVHSARISPTSFSLRAITTIIRDRNAKNSTSKISSSNFGLSLSFASVEYLEYQFSKDQNRSGEFSRRRFTINETESFRPVSVSEWKIGEISL